MNIALDVNQPSMFQDFFGTISQQCGRGYEFLTTGVVAGIEFSKSNIICAVAVVAVANAIFIEMSVNLTLFFYQKIVVGTIYNSEDYVPNICAIVFMATWTALNGGLFFICPLMHPVAQATVSVASAAGYLFFVRPRIYPSEN